MHEQGDGDAGVRKQGDGDAGVLLRLGELAAIADNYAPVSQLLDEHLSPCLVPSGAEIYSAVWPEAARLRDSGELLAQGKQLRCKVVILHGEQDSHPAQGVYEPLRRVLDDFDLHLVTRCGHSPWLERYARDLFYTTLFGYCGFA